MVIFIMLPAALAAVLYAVVAALFLPAFGECPWRTHLPSVAPRLTLLVAVLAVQLSGSTDWLFGTTSYYVALTICTVVICGFIYHTRVFVIQGGPVPILPDLTGQVVMITGANAGIGYHTTSQLAAAGATVFMCCRNAQRAKDARQAILRENHNIDASQLHVVLLDLANLSSVRQAVQVLSAQSANRKAKIDVLINNAGLMHERKVMTHDGNELVMQCNHLGHYLLTRLLLQHGLLAHRSARVLNVTSSTYVFAPYMDVDDLNCERRRYTMFGQYAQSKLANILFTQELARRYNGANTTMLQCHAIHPGLVRTDVTRHMPWYMRWPNTMFAAALASLQKTPAQGAWNTTFVAALPSSSLLLSTTDGSYWVNREIQRLRGPCCAVDDLDRARQLWDKSAKLVGL